MTARLISEDRFAQPDEVYQLLIDAHGGLLPAQSQLLNAKLVLLLANHIGDPQVLAEAIAAARAGLLAHERGPDPDAAA